MEYVVTGIGTDVGKTVVSALLCEALGANYWKPVQTGASDQTDRARVQSLVSRDVHFFPEVYSLDQPISPHAAAALEGVYIEPAKLDIPVSRRPLIIEGAGGVHVPLNDRQTFLDLLQVWDISVIIVSKNYLGSINHTLMTIEVLQQRGIPIAGLVFNGSSTPLSERVIASYSKVPVLGYVPEVDRIDASFIKSHANAWKRELEAKLFETFPMNLEIEFEKRLFLNKKESRPKAAF